MKRILCIGDACCDIVLPYGKAKTTKQNVDINVFGGGTVANTASGLGRLGCDVAFLGCAGTDSYGHKLKDELIGDGVDCQRFRLDERFPTTLVLAIIDEANDRDNFLLTRENASQFKIFPEDLDERLLDEFDIFHTSGMVLFENPSAASISDFMEKARKRNKITSMDINLRIETRNQNRQYFDKALENTVYLFGSSEDELMPLTGISDPQTAAQSLVRDNRIVISRLGSKGSTVYTTADCYHHDGYKVSVADALGAGDSFNCGFLYGLANDEPLENCNRYGCAVAAISITKAGARNCPNKRELDQFLKDYQ